MKRILVSLLAAALMPAFAQSTVNPNAKVDPKNNKVSNPVVEKPKQKLMTRDELRACMKANDANRAEGEAIKTAQAAQTKERADLLKDKDDLSKKGEALTVRTNELLAERAALLKLNEELKVSLPKAKKEEAEALKKDYDAKAEAHSARIDALNKEKLDYKALAPGFDSRVEAHNQAAKALEARAEAYLDKLDEWKADCSNKPYDEADEIAIKKEKAAAAK
ncbi:hypothetical protein [Roseateles sp.]|uniref:hypothetical protein n=1 Tax=Roseateles sp. TaxID=1971397 RepID=UPI003BA7C0DB